MRGKRVGQSRSDSAPHLLGQVGGQNLRKRKVAESINAPPVSGDEDETDSSCHSPHSKEDVGKGQAQFGIACVSEPGRTGSSARNWAARHAIQPATCRSTIRSSETTQRRKKMLEDTKSSQQRRTASDSRRQRLSNYSGSSNQVDNQPSTRARPSSAGHLTDEFGFERKRRSDKSYKRGVLKSTTESQVHKSRVLIGDRHWTSANSTQRAGRRCAAKVQKSIESDDELSIQSIKVPRKFSLSPSASKKDEFGVDGGASGPEPIPCLKVPPEWDFSSLERKEQVADASQAKDDDSQISLHVPQPLLKMPQNDGQILRNIEKSYRINSGDDAGTGDEACPNFVITSPVFERPKLRPRSRKEAASCPWCGKLVDENLLEHHAKGERMPVKAQKRFCEAHQKVSALTTWQSKGYPAIEWERLQDRLAEHVSFLMGIISGASSHFRTLLALKIQIGEARSIKKEDNMSPGYYGPRGYRVMCDYLVDTFSAALKERAIADRVIVGRGSAAFIQNVLVPELAVRLIQDDMRVSSARARSIMEESKALGEMVNEELYV